jgi:hypothetical protein
MGGKIVILFHLQCASYGKSQGIIFQFGGFKLIAK